jgi:hypothetical protein
MVEVLQDPTYAPSQTEAAVTSPAVTRWLAVGRGDAACPRNVITSARWQPMTPSNEIYDR